MVIQIFSLAILLLQRSQLTCCVVGLYAIKMQNVITLPICVCVCLATQGMASLSATVSVEQYISKDEELIH